MPRPAGFLLILFLVVVGIAAGVHRFNLTWEILDGSTRVKSYNPSGFDARYDRLPWLTLAHIIPGMIFLIIGPLQFIASFRRKYPWLHRLLGKIYLASGFVAAMTALLFVAYLPVYGTFTSSVAVTIGSCLFLVSIVQAYRHIRARRVALHREWMIRTFALGLGIVTFRLLIPVFMSPMFGATFAEAWDVVSWLGFILNLCVAEIWINQTRFAAR